MSDDYLFAEAYVYDVYDGDTIHYHANLGYYHMAINQIGRLIGINTPELRPLVSRDDATKSKEHLIELIKRYSMNKGEVSERLGHKLIIKSYKMNDGYAKMLPSGMRDNFGRWLVILSGYDTSGREVNINRKMVEDGYAIVWSPGMPSDFNSLTFGGVQE